MNREEMMARCLEKRHTHSGFRVFVAVSLYVVTMAAVIGGIAAWIWRKG